MSEKYSDPIQSVRDRVVEIRTSVGSSLGGLTTPLILVVVWLATIFLARCDARQDVHDEYRNKSRKITEITDKAKTALPAADRRRIETLESANAKLAAEIEGLRARRQSQPLSDPCQLCRIPAERLR